MKLVSSSTRYNNLYDNEKQYAHHRDERQPFMWVQPPNVLLQKLQAKLSQQLLGKDVIIHKTIICLLAGGHLLVEDVPGVGKTLLGTSIARLLGGTFHRIQFTSDLMPADIIGGMVLNGHGGELKYREGPIMANVVLADELNRASTRTQSALLEALEHGSVSIEGVTHQLPKPFVFIATQNPLRYEGTNRLLEAQLDRFMMQLSIGYPDQLSERDMLGEFAASLRPEVNRLRAIISQDEWLQMQQEVQQVFVHPSLLDYMTEIAAATRQDSSLLLGLSPRALRDWLRAAQASAYIEGRGYIVPDDLIQLGEEVLAHRIELNGFSSQEHSKREYIANLLQAIPMAVRKKGRSQ